MNSLITKESLDCQTSDTASAGSERRRGVKIAPRFCLSFSSRFRLLTLLMLSALPSFFMKIVYGVFTQIQFRPGVRSGERVAATLCSEKRSYALDSLQSRRPRQQVHHRPQLGCFPCREIHFHYAIQRDVAVRVLAHGLWVMSSSCLK